MKQLRDDDARALDLLLEDGLRASRGADHASLDTATVNRVGLVESVLRIFGEMPTEDPPHDLVAKTLSHVYAGTLPTGEMPDAGAGLNG